jgi:hypothetical protein
MSDDLKIMKWGTIIAGLIMVVRIVLEQTGAPETVNFIFGVAWLYFILPILFAWSIRMKAYAAPYRILLKDVLLFAVYTRVMVMITYMLAYVFRWNPRRFAFNAGGNVGDDVRPLMGLLLIPLRNAILWVIMASIVGMIVGSITLLLKRKPSSPAASA